MKLKIDRAKWHTGRYGDDKPEDVGAVALLNSQGFMCCLGFLGLACGYQPSDLDDKGEPQNLDDLEKWPESIIDEETWNDTDLAGRLMETNDDHNDTDEAREGRVTELMAEGDIEVEFVGEYPELADG